MEINFWEVVTVATLIVVTGSAFILAGGLTFAGTRLGKTLAVILVIIGTASSSATMTKFFLAGNGIPAQEEALLKKVNTSYHLLSLAFLNDRKTTIATLLNKRNDLIEIYELSQPPPKAFTVVYENGKIIFKPDIRQNFLGI
ncbi:hypothetical protein HZB06_00525 [Candidatus Wolfebacteria bacterium]|nr:hypothetical protein [Candidatus Wolfebacteria bacterium]